MATRSTTKPTKHNATESFSDRARAVYRVEAARHRAASKAADAILGQSLTFGAVLESDAYHPFVEQLQREEATLLDGKTQIRNDDQAEKIRDAIDAALPGWLREQFRRYQDWKAFQGANEAEAAFLIGLAIGRRGAR